MFKQIVKAVAFAHTHNISHRDLKLENVLIARHGRTVFWVKCVCAYMCRACVRCSDGSPKITDFGLSLIMTPYETTRATAGSLCYFAPELLSCATNRGPSIDVWCLGNILYALLVGRLPFELNSKGKDDLFRRISRCVSADCCTAVYISFGPIGQSLLFL